MKSYKILISDLLNVNLNWKLCSTFNKSGIIYIFYTPSLKNLYRSIVYRKNIYVFICWGIPSKNNLLKLKLYIFSKRCAFFIFNEEITKNKYFEVKKSNTSVIPHLVDTRFFLSNNKSYQVKDFYLVCGDNSRDEDLVMELAEMGLSIYRITREPKVLKIYSSKPNKVQLFYQISPEKLKEFYSKCTAVLVPLLGNIEHCAGQTSLLEGIAAKKKVICSSGLSSEVANGFFKIVRVDSGSPMDWLAAVKDLTKFISSEDIFINFAILNNIDNMYLKSMNENFGKNQSFYVE